MSDDTAGDLDAGDFSTWLTAMRGALRGERDAAVPCNGCTACCTSSQFVPIGPDETETISAIPRALLFPAPRMPGHFVLGYDERGHCPMLVDGACTIYEHRPRTCRTYDCRVLTAAGVSLDDHDKAAIAERVARWRFSHLSPSDEKNEQAVRDAATFLEDAVASVTERAVYAVELSDHFLEGPVPVDPDAIRRKVSSASTG